MSTDTTPTPAPEARTMPTWALSVVRERNARLAKIAAKLGVEAPVLTVTNERPGLVPGWFLTRDEADRIEVYGPTFHPTCTLVDVIETGTTPTLPGGYRVLATVEHFPVANLVSCSPLGAERGLAAALLHAEPTCDHCGLARDRKATIVVEAEDGTVQRVGRSCLKDFLGFHGGSLDALWTLLREASTDEDEDDYRVARGEAGQDTLGFLALAAAATRQHGFTSVQVERGYSTKARVLDHLFGRAKDVAEADITVTEADVRQAEAIAAWLLASEDQGDYIVNLRSLVQNGYVTGRYYGLAVSAPQAFLRHLGQVAERQARAEAPPAGPVPTGKATIEGLVIATDTKWSDYGARYVMTVLLANGSKVWGSQPSNLDIEVGATVRFSATVEAKAGDPTFGFYKRPTKAVLVSEAPTA